MLTLTALTLERDLQRAELFAEPAVLDLGALDLIADHRLEVSVLLHRAKRHELAIDDFLVGARSLSIAADFRAEVLLEVDATDARAARDRAESDGVPFTGK
jgi:hypothetical protein